MNRHLIRKLAAWLAWREIETADINGRLAGFERGKAVGILEGYSAGWNDATKRAEFDKLWQAARPLPLGKPQPKARVH